MLDDNTMHLIDVISQSQEYVSMNWLDSIGLSCAQCLEQMKEDTRLIGRVNESIIDKCSKISEICADILGDEAEPQTLRLVLRRR